jgi:serine/threonine protein kinase
MPRDAPDRPAVVRFGPFECDLRSGELSRDGERTRLQDQPLEILRRLVERPGELVSRDELRERLWPNGTIVDFEHGVNSALKRLRDALGDSADHPRFVETVPRRGYRLVVPIEVLRADPEGGRDAGEAAPTVRPLQAGELLPLGHYRLLERVGSGSMGEVYRAEDVDLQRQVAVKFIPEEYLSDRDRLKRFQREAQVLAALDHPAIAAIHGFGEADGRRFLVLEFVDGEPLSSRLARGPLRAAEALDLCAHVAEALAAAHRKGIVHRDLKPEHVCIRKDGRVKVLDFGLARIIEPHGESGGGLGGEQRTSRPGLVLGTCSYMSPEQAAGRPVDYRTDIWALGCLLFECLTGRRAFQKDTAVQTLLAVLEEEPDCTALPGRLPPRARALVRRCLRKDPEDRWQNVRDLSDELRWLASGDSTPRRFSWVAASLPLKVLAAGVILVVGALLGWVLAR